MPDDIQLLHPTQTLRLPASGEHELLTHYEVCDSAGQRVLRQGGKYFCRPYIDRNGTPRQWWEYIEHPEEEAMCRRLGREFPGHAITAIHIYGEGVPEGHRVRFEATQSQPAPAAMIESWRASLRRKAKSTTANKPKKPAKKKARGGDVYEGVEYAPAEL